MTISNKFGFQLFIYLQLLLLCTGSSVQLTFPSSYIQLEDSGITLYFEFDDTTQTLLMGLDMPQILRYYAVGFANKGNSGMHIFDVVTFLFTQNLGTYSVQVLDLYSTRDDRPPTDTSIGGTSDYILIDSYVGQGRSQVLFKRKYNTGDAFDYQFDPNLTKDNIVMNYAWNGVFDTGFSDHGDRCGTVISSMYNGFQGVADSYSATFISPELAFAIHGFGLLIGWGILIEIALQFARYRKYSNYYLKIHLYITTFLYIFTAFASALAIYIQSGEKMRDGLTLFHYYLGIVNLVLCTLQVFLGFVFKSKMVKPKATHLLPLLSKFHLISGIIIYVITKVLIATGVYMGYPDCIPYLYVYLALIFVFRVGQEVAHRFYKKLDGKVVLNMKVADSHLESYQKLLDLLNKKTPISEIFENADLKGMKWAILDNRVFDIKKITHPGGNFMLEQINGREIGRFIYGSYGLESIKQTTQHLHTKAVIEIVKNNLIGTIQNNSQLFIENAKPSEENHGKGEWVLESKTQLTPLIVQFNFVSKQYKINAYTDDIRYIGHHMKVSHRSLKKVRLYTLVLSQTESRTRRRELLWDKNYKDPNTIVNSPKDSKSESLPLILKKYDNPKDKTLSSFIHESQLLTDGFIIEGPFGTGLDLTSESTGIHSIFAAGTGILPFIDLFDYLLEGVLDPSSGHNLFKNGFKLHLFASFGQLTDFIGLDICEKLAKACKDKGMDDAFKMVIRAQGAKTNELYTVTSDVFDNAFVEKYGDKGCTRAYVCGPPMFNHHIPSSLQLIGVAKTSIILV